MTLRNVTDFMSRSCPHFDTCSVPKKKLYLKSVKQLAHKYCTKIVKQQKKKKLNSIDNPPPPHTPHPNQTQDPELSSTRRGRELFFTISKLFCLNFLICKINLLERILKKTSSNKELTYFDKTTKLWCW